MKKILLVILISVITYSSHSQSRWSIGVMLGGSGNISKFSGGMANADAKFSNVPHGSGQIGVYARYKMCDRWSFQSGYDFSEIGFTYLFAKDYSLLEKKQDHYDVIKTGTCISRMPALMIYNSRLNCRNIRFIAGAGLAVEAIDKKWKSESGDFLESVAGMGEAQSLSYNPDSKSYEAHATKVGNGSFTWILGVEKVFKKGNMLSLTFQGNCGFSPIAISTVYYTADGTSYDHTYTNYGSYAAFGISYYFQPIGSRKANRAVEKNNL